MALALMGLTIGTSGRVAYRYLRVLQRLDGKIRTDGDLESLRRAFETDMRSTAVLMVTWLVAVPVGIALLRTVFSVDPEGLVIVVLGGGLGLPLVLVAGGLASRAKSLQVEGQERQLIHEAYVKRLHGPYLSIPAPDEPGALSLPEGDVGRLSAAESREIDEPAVARQASVDRVERIDELNRPPRA